MLYSVATERLKNMHPQHSFTNQHKAITIMTVLEKQYMEAMIAINRNMREPAKIDWEKRRFEIAKECQSAIIQGLYANSNAIKDDWAELSAQRAVDCADALIKVLKKNPIK